ncbi:DMT family transporter [Marinomonas sp.]|uniref:DMT family transporter n=1 Tax=Marinomonas sp. TaxID=1904862 RepID=UPI003BAD91C3
MSGRTLGSAIFVLVLGSFFATLCDVVVKLADAKVAIYQLTFLRIVFMCLILLPIVFVRMWRRPDHLSVGIKLHFIRGHLWIVAALFLVLSLSELSLATANAVFYTIPIFIMVFATVFYKERLTLDVVVTAICGFVGVLVILRPTEVSMGMISAVLFAVSIALNSLLIKKIPQQQDMLYGLLITQMCALPVSGGLAWWEGEPLQLELVIYAALASVCSILYCMACLTGYRYVESSKVTSAEYSGLIFAFLIGWLFFDETLDMWLFIGSFLIIAPLFYLTHRDARKLRKDQLLSNARANLNAG